MIFSCERHLNKQKRIPFEIGPIWKRKFLNFEKHTHCKLCLTPSGKLGFIYHLIPFSKNYWILNDHRLGFALIFYIVMTDNYVYLFYTNRWQSAHVQHNHFRANLFQQIELNEGDLIKTNGLFRELQIVDNRKHLSLLLLVNEEQKGILLRTLKVWSSEWVCQFNLPSPPPKRSASRTLLPSAALQTGNQPLTPNFVQLGLSCNKLIKDIPDLRQHRGGGREAKEE